MDIDKALSALSNPVRRQILASLKDRSNFPPALPEHADLSGVTQQKNKRNKPVHMEIPIAPELRVVMDASPMGDMAFLVNGYGRAFTSNGFGNKFRDWCDAAGLPQCSAHGLRKAAAARLAELGCTEQEIMSITGHKTSKEIARYTKSANQKVRAERAIDKMSAKK